MKDDEADFLRTWAKVQRTQLDVGELLGSCKTCVDGKCQTPGPYQKTSVGKSYIYGEVLQPSGDFSRVFIKTRNGTGFYRDSGGDGWQVYLKGPSILTANVFDLGNGTYEVVFLPVVPGKYRLYANLIYTACIGIRNPPETHKRLGKKLDFQSMLVFLVMFCNSAQFDGQAIEFEQLSMKFSKMFFFI